MEKEDFEKSLEQIHLSFSNTRVLIGATENSDWEIFSSELRDISDRFNAGKSVKLEGLEKIRDIWKSRVPFIDERGNPFVLYIKDHKQARRYGNYRRFHVAWCWTLDWMKRKGRSDRYHKKSDIENEFFHIIYGHGDEDNKKLEVCMNCLKLMKKKVAPEPFISVVGDFNTKGVFDRWGKQNLQQPTRGIFPDVLPSNWDQISKSKKIAVGWKCQKCGKNCSNNRGHLHTHHKNGVLGDVRDQNLVVLCNTCHANEPFHVHMKNGLNRISSFETHTYSKSHMNMLENFIREPEKYATGTEKSNEKLKDIRHFFGMVKDKFSPERQDEFSKAVRLYESRLKRLL